MQISLGDTGITTSALALGCARIGSTLTPLSRRASIALLQEAFELGIRHFDTASIYGQGDSERYLAAALRQRREQVCLSSKAGQLLSPRQALLAPFKAPLRFLAARRPNLRNSIAEQRERGVPRCFKPDYITRSLASSLRRLRTDHLDVFYLHSPDTWVLEDASLMERLQSLREQGQVRALGVSCDELEVAMVAARCAAIQVVQFSFEGDERSLAVLNELSRRGKTAVLRGLMKSHADAATETLMERFVQTLRLPALGGIIVGTTNVAHLRENAAAFERAAIKAQDHDAAQR